MSHPTSVTLAVDRLAPAANAVRRAVEVLAQGRLVAYPTDTLYGLAVDPRRADAVERLFRAKGRPADMAVPLIAADLEQAARHAGRLTVLARSLAERFWPGPLTLVVDAWPALDARLLAGGRTVAVRVPDHAVARALARELGHPVTATSANRSGSQPATTAAAAVSAVGCDLACVLDAGPAKSTSPSTIVDVRGSSPVLLRHGVVAWERVLAVCGNTPRRTETRSSNAGSG